MGAETKRRPAAMASFSETLQIIAEMTGLTPEETKIFTGIAKGSVAIEKTKGVEEVVPHIHNACEHALADLQREASCNSNIKLALNTLDDLTAHD
jgi:hypothetical protein